MLGTPPGLGELLLGLVMAVAGDYYLPTSHVTAMTPARLDWNGARKVAHDYLARTR